MIEQIVQLEHAVDRHAAHLHALLQAGVDAVDRPAEDARARQDGAVGLQPLFGGVGAAFIASILAGEGREAFARAEEVDAARLETAARDPTHR